MAENATSPFLFEPLVNWNASYPWYIVVVCS